MPDLLQSGSSWLRGKRHTQMAHAVTYARGEDEVELDATAGDTRFERGTSDGGLEVVANTRDYIFRATDLVLDSETVTPLEGDTVVDDGVTYTVVKLGAEPCWKAEGVGRSDIRVHCLKSSQDGA